MTHVRWTRSRAEGVVVLRRGVIEYVTNQKSGKVCGPLLCPNGLVWRVWAEEWASLISLAHAADAPGGPYPSLCERSFWLKRTIPPLPPHAHQIPHVERPTRCQAHGAPMNLSRRPQQPVYSDSLWLLAHACSASLMKMRWGLQSYQC